jgi:hypothetical protein
MKSTKNLLGIIVLTSVELVMTNQPALTLDVQHQILSSTNTIREGVQQFPDQNTEFVERGLVKHIHLRPPESNSDFDYDYDSYNSPSALEPIKR